MAAPPVENRPFPYFVTEANLLKQIKESAAEGLFKSFELLLGKDVRENGVRFEVLLGVYTNAIQFVRFLETALAVGCLNTEFKDLRRMIDGKIQFKISVPTIAHGDGRRPSKRRQYLVMKSCQKHHISAEIELSMLDLQLLHSSVETPLDYTEFVGAVKTVTSALQFGVSALERGLVDSVLNVKLRHAPPLFILESLSDPTFTDGGLKKTVRSDLISMFKTHLIEKSFFLDKAQSSPRAREFVLNMLSDLLGAVSTETVFKGTKVYTLANGEPISGVLETSDNVMRRLLTILGVVSETLMGPSSYASYVVRGENLVTAVSYGRAMRSFEQFMKRIVDEPARVGSIEDDLAPISEGQIGSGRTEIRSAVVRVGNHNVAVESLQRMYHEAQFPFPLNRRIQYTYFFPVGLYLPLPKYSTSPQIRGLEDEYLQSVESWVVNKNNTVLCFGQLNALKTVCHPRLHNPNPCVQAVSAKYPPQGPASNYAAICATTKNLNLFSVVQSYYQGKNRVQMPQIYRVSGMTLDELLHPSAHELLRLELHPLFDFFTVSEGDGRFAYKAAHRTVTGNLPEAFAPVGFHEARGRQLDLASRVTHVIDQSTIDLVQETAFDPAYPVICYVIQAVIHGQEEKFLANQELIALVIDSYWLSSGRLAFVNSFDFILFICNNMGNGAINKDAYQHYRRIMGELLALEQALLRLVGSEDAGPYKVGGLVHAILDANLLPPFAYRDIFTDFFNHPEARAPAVRHGDVNAFDTAGLGAFMDVWPSMVEQRANFQELFRQRMGLNRSRDPYVRVGPVDPRRSILREKLFYYVFLPTCTNGHLCGLGVDFEHVAVTVAYNGPAFFTPIPDGDDVLAHLEPGTLRSLLELSEMKITVRMLRLLAACMVTLPVGTDCLRVSAARDPCQWAATHEEGHRVSHSVLVNGLPAFAVSEKVRDVMETMFYPVPFHKLYSDPLVAGTYGRTIGDYLGRIPTQRDGVQFNVPVQVMAEYEEWHRSPILNFARKCQPSAAAISAMLAMHFKLSPPSFICQARHRIHIGVGMTVVRTDEVLAETVMYSSHASTSVFVGQPSVNRREVRSDAVTFEVTHELATLDTGLGYSSIITPANVATVTTDMGVHCQDLFAAFPSEAFQDRSVTEYIRKSVGALGKSHQFRDPRTFLGGVNVTPNLPGLANGQLATCEVVLTPVTADLSYFQRPNSPRGRTSCVVSCPAYQADSADALLYDHSLSDPNYEYRSTVNPWASQIGSLSDVLYNTCHRQSLNLTVYSPSRAFFNKEEILKSNKGLFTLVSEYSSRLGPTAATSGTDVQYVVISGTDVFLEQPCVLLQEAFPTLAASHRGMLDSFMSYKETHAPVHHNQFLIEEVAPMKRLFKIGNKINV